MATKEQLRALRKKHHLGEFRRTRKIYKHRNSHNSMARRKKSYHRGKSGGMKGVWGQLLGVGIYVLYEQYIEGMIPLQEPMLSIAELGVSYWISKKGGIVGDIGKAGVYINVYQLMKYFASTTLPNLGGKMQTSNVTSMFAY
jgi:hypothetical protein